MRIGLDVMGGDHAPDAILDGALAAADRLGPGDRVVLFGDESVIRRALESCEKASDHYEVVPTSEAIAMDEPPVEAVRSKPDSSIAVMAKRAGRKADPEIRLDAVISAGNTGAMVSAAQMHMRRLPNVHRPGIAVTFPTFAGPVILIDVGANIEPKPHHLAQYGIMGDVYAKRIYGIESPRVALMNVGGEEQKGTPEIRQARDLLRERPNVNFTGYIEGRAVFNGGADVVITDGVVGNVMIKLAEGLSEGIFKAIGREIGQADPNLAQRFQPIVKEIYARHDYHEHGGAPLLGVNGICLIAHGSSEARTICNAIAAVRQFGACHINDAIVERLGAMEEANA